MAHDNRGGNAVSDYLLRDVPEDFWRKVKAKAAAKGESVRDVILRLLQQYVGK
jgi:hypothetical protein